MRSRPKSPTMRTWASTWLANASAPIDWSRCSPLAVWAPCTAPNEYDGEFRQTVAVKILPVWATGRHTISRLRAERQILSSLQHPGIAPLLDGGQTGDGFPYLVTAFIDGEPITRFVQGRSPELDSVLRIFLDVADAVDYAHGQGVVHRDLKPSNILVDKAGHPHLLDFGIAKIEGGMLPNLRSRGR